MRYHIKESIIFKNKSIEAVSNKNMYEVGESSWKHLLSHEKGTYLLQTWLSLDTTGLDGFLIAVIISFSHFFYS